MTKPSALLKAGAICAAALTSAGAFAQDAVADRMQQCRTIADTAARVACYDSIEVGGAVAASPAPAALPPPTFGSNQLPRTPQPQPTPAPTFGSNQLPAPPAARAAVPDRIEAGIAAVSEREPGVLLFTLADNTQWQTVDTVTQTYERPRSGTTVEIVSASMGSYQMRYGGQRSIRVRRVR